jgi:multiple sugar transport system substrate-binding protein
VFSVGDRFAFDNPQSAEAFEYLVRLINTDHVAPPASATNGDFSRNQFLLGRMALFQSGNDNLAMVADQAPFRWGVAMMPAGPKGRVSVTNGIAAAGNSATEHPDAVRQVLAWMGSRRGNEYLGARGAAIAAVLAAHSGTRRGRLRRRLRRSQAVLRRDVPGSPRCVEQPCRGTTGRELSRTALADHHVGQSPRCA